MATPSWVSYSLFEMSAQRLARLARIALVDHGCECAGVSELVLDEEMGDIVCDSHTTKCSDEEVALALSQKWFGFVLTYRAPPITDYVYLYVWRDDQQTAMALEVTSSALYSETADLEEGEWLEQLLCALGAVTAADACAFGDDERMFECVDPAEVADRAKTDELIEHSGPAFFLIASRYLGKRKRDARPEPDRKGAVLRSFEVGEAYVAFSNLRRTR